MEYLLFLPVFLPFDFLTWCPQIRYLWNPKKSCLLSYFLQFAPRYVSLPHPCPLIWAIGVILGDYISCFIYVWCCWLLFSLLLWCIFLTLLVCSILGLLNFSIFFTGFLNLSDRFFQLVLMGYICLYIFILSFFVFWSLDPVYAYWGNEMR